MAAVRLHATSLQQHVNKQKLYATNIALVFCFSDTRHCLRYIAFYGRETYFVFIGDTRIKELYLGFLSHLQQNDRNFSINSLLQTENDHSYFDNKLKIKIEFIWSANISTEMIEQFR